MKRKELLKSKEYWVTQFQINLFETVAEYLGEHKMNKTQFAEQLGVSKGYISQVLNGDFDHKISKYVELSLACNKVPIIKMMDIDDYIGDEICGIKHIYSTMSLQLPVKRHAVDTPSKYRRKVNDFNYSYNDN